MLKTLQWLAFCLLACGVSVCGHASDKASFHFAYEISPILAKVGCSAAECHGGATGQGGFKLSLFAENPSLDYEAIVHELDGRRLDLARPQDSLFLRKPSRDRIKHKGGRLFHESDQEYQLLYDWISNGAPYQSGETHRLTGIDLQRDGEACRVMASFESDGVESHRDVTHLALLESTDEQVATIDERGRIETGAPGETWFLARYGKYSSRIPFRTPFGASDAERKLQSEHPLDRVWLTRLDQLGLKPADRASEMTLARRLYFDLTGRPPDPLELETFLSLPRAERVATTAAKLVQSEAFDRVFARAIAGFFEIPVAGKDPRNAQQRNDQLRSFFLGAMSDRASLSEIAGDILTGPVGQSAWRHFADPRDRAEYVGRTLLGMRIGCARCHNHPLDRWTNEEHLAFAAYFTDPRPGPGGAMMAGKFFLPGSGTAVKPRLLPVALEDPPDGLAREEAVNWLIQAGAQQQFARNMGNRLFGRVMGRSLVELADDHRLTNPAVHEPILSLLAERFLELDTDVRAFVKFLVSSDMYAVSSSPPNPDAVSGDPERQYLARREARSLSSEELKAAAEFVLGVPLGESVPPDSPLARQLYLLNSGMLQKGLATEGNQVELILLFEPDPQRQLKELFRLILSRDPTQSEREAFQPLIQGTSDSSKPFTDLAFALLASREFGSIR